MISAAVVDWCMVEIYIYIYMYHFCCSWLINWYIYINTYISLYISSVDSPTSYFLVTSLLRWLIGPQQRPVGRPTPGSGPGLSQGPDPQGSAWYAKELRGRHHDHPGRADVYDVHISMIIYDPIDVHQSVFPVYVYLSIAVPISLYLYLSIQTGSPWYPETEAGWGYHTKDSLSFMVAGAWLVVLGVLWQ